MSTGNVFKASCTNVTNNTVTGITSVPLYVGQPVLVAYPGVDGVSGTLWLYAGAITDPTIPEARVGCPQASPFGQISQQLADVSPLMFNADVNGALNAQTGDPTNLGGAVSSGGHTYYQFALQANTSKS